MKIRNGWVGNSSSSSFILLLDNPENKEEFETWFEDCGYRADYENEKLNNIKTTISDIKTLYNNKSISFNIANNILDSLRDTVYDIPGSFLMNNSEEPTLDVDFEVYDEEFTHEKILDLLWDAWNKQGNAKCENGNCIENNIRVFNKIEDWKIQLNDKSSYLYQIIKEEVERGIEDNLEGKINGDNVNLKYREYRCFDDFITIYDIRNNKSYIDFIDMLVQQKINYIQDILLNDYENLDCYIITFCTEDGNSTKFDYIGRSGYIFRNALFCIRDENS